MKRMVFLLGLIIGLNSLGFCGYEIYQNQGQYYDVSVSSNYAVAVSSSTAVTIPAVTYGVSRRFKVLGQPTGSLFYQLGGSTTTITSTGFDLEPHTYYVENDYFGIMYFKSTGSAVNLRVQYLKRQS